MSVFFRAAVPFHVDGGERRKKNPLPAFFNVGIGCRGKVSGVTEASRDRHYGVTVLKCFTGTKLNQEDCYDPMHSALLHLSDKVDEIVDENRLFLDHILRLNAE